MHDEGKGERTNVCMAISWKSFLSPPFRSHEMPGKVFPSRSFFLLVRFSFRVLLLLPPPSISPLADWTGVKSIETGGNLTTFAHSEHFYLRKYFNLRAAASWEGLVFLTCLCRCQQGANPLLPPKKRYCFSHQQVPAHRPVCLSAIERKQRSPFPPPPR